MKCKNCYVKIIRKAIKQQLQYSRRDRGYIEDLLDKVYEQQKYMYDNRAHFVVDRIVSISQPYIRPIIRGKAAIPVVFGAKMDLSMDGNGIVVSRNCRLMHTQCTGQAFL